MPRRTPEMREEHRRKIYKLTAEGVGTSEIARILGISDQLVSHDKRVVGLTDKNGKHQVSEERRQAGCEKTRRLVSRKRDAKKCAECGGKPEEIFQGRPLCGECLLTAGDYDPDYLANERARLEDPRKQCALSRAREMNYSSSGGASIRRKIDEFREKIRGIPPQRKEPRMITLRKGDRGPAVVRFQELSDLIGFDYGENDGIFGCDTERAARDVQERLGLVVDGVVGPRTWASLKRHASTISEINVGITVKPLDPGGAVIDLRGKHDPPKLISKKRPTRSADEITGILLHQTGCDMPDDPRAWHRLNAHFGVLRSGQVVYVNDVLDRINHAQGLSTPTIGIEIEGNFAGLEGKEATVWKPGGGPHTLTQEQKNALYTLIQILEHERDRLMFSIDFIHAHRQSSAMREADPGQEIWQEFGIPLQEHFSATDGGSNFCTGDKHKGKPIPREWDSRRTRRYWEK